MLGLTTLEAERQRRHFGRNELVDGQKESLWATLLSRIQNPLVIVLVLAAGASALLGDRISFFIILTIVLLSILLDFLNTYKSERAAEALKERVRVTAQTLRDGEWVELGLTELVPGDVVRLTAGKLVPADGSVIETKDLFVN